MRFASQSRRVTLANAAVALMTVATLAIAGCGGGSDTGNSGSSGSDSENVSAAGFPISADPALDGGRELVESKCKMCHNLDRIKQADYDKAKWESTVSRMRSNGAVLTDDEASQIAEYLASR